MKSLLAKNNVMYSESEDDAISWISSSPEGPKSNYRKSKNNWRVPNHECYNLTNSKRKRRKTKRNDSGFNRKNEYYKETKLSNLNLKSTSPILSYKNRSPTVDDSPVLYKKQCTDSENELTASPVLNKRKNKLIKLRKAQLLKTKRNNKTCVRNLSLEMVSPLKSSAINSYSETNISLEKSPLKTITNTIKPKSAEQSTEFMKSSVANHRLQNDDEFEIELIKSQECTQHFIEIPESQEIAENFIETSSKLKHISQNSIKTPSLSTDYSIDCVTSEHSSTITISSNCTVVRDSLEHSSENVEFSSPKRKKKYKPGTLSHQLARILRKQKTDVGIWKHELYLATTSSYQIPATKEDHMILQLKIVKIQLDFGVDVLECVDGNSENCLIIADLNYLIDLVLRASDTIKIFPPYYIKYFESNQVVTKAFVNVYKIVRL